MSSTHCSLRTANRSICHGVVRRCVFFFFLIKVSTRAFISIVRTGNFIMYALHEGTGDIRRHEETGGHKQNADE